METKELKISVPQGYEIDKENSTFECIKFKKIEQRWRDNEDANIAGYYITSNSEILHIENHYVAICKNERVFSHKMVMRRYSTDLLDTSHKAYRIKEIKETIVI